MQSWPPVLTAKVPASNAAAFFAGAAVTALAFACCRTDLPLLHDPAPAPCSPPTRPRKRTLVQLGVNRYDSLGVYD